jgi:hypothetical protein
MSPASMTVRREAIDRRLSSATASTVHEAIADDEHLRAVARSVECRSRICRVEITDDGSTRLRWTVLEAQIGACRRLYDVRAPGPTARTCRLSALGLCHLHATVVEGRISASFWQPYAATH